jgi:MFS transporter, FSR family, fosmidomycin resistance protein
MATAPEARISEQSDPLATLTEPVEATCAPASVEGTEAAAEVRHANVPILALLTLAHLVVDAYASSVPALLPFWQDHFHLSYGLAGLITGISNVTSSVAQPVVGIITDRGRDPRWIAVAVVLAAGGVAATGLMPGFPLFLLCVIAGGLGVSAFHPQGYKLVGQHSGSRQAVATSWFLVGGNLGVAIGPLAGTAAVLRFGVGGTAVLFLPGALFALATWWLFTQLEARRASQLRRDGGSRSATKVRAEKAPSGVGVLPLQRRLIGLGVLMTLVAVRTTVSSSLISFVPLYYVRVAGTDEGLASRMLSGVLFAGALATLAGGYLADRFGRMRVLAVSLLPIPPLLLLFLSLPAGSLGAVVTLWSVGALVTSSFSITVVLAQELWFERRALVSGLIVGVAFGLGGLFVPLVGTAGDAWGLTAALRLLAALPIVALGLTAALAAILAPSWSTQPEAGHN